MAEVKKLAGIVTQIRGVSYQPTDIRDADNPDAVPLLRANNIQDSGLDFSELVYIDKKRVKDEQYLKAGDILICTSSGSKNLVGKAAYVSEDIPFVFGAFCKVVRSKHIEPCYLGQFFQSPRYRREISNASAGANINNIRAEHIDELELQIPPLYEQRKIAAVLDKIDSLTAKRRRQLEKLDELVKSRFVEMFGDCRTNPMGWTTNQLGDIAEVGSSKRVFVEELKDTGVPFYRGTEVGALADGKPITPELYITEQHYKELCNASGTPQRGDLLMPSICPDGRIWVVDTDEPFYFKDGRVLWVHEICNSYNPTFLLYTLKDRIMTDYSSIASGTTFAELKIFALKACNIFDVPLALQEQFAAFIHLADQTKLSVRQSLDALETLKKSLMQNWFG